MILLHTHIVFMHPRRGLTIGYVVSETDTEIFVEDPRDDEAGRVFLLPRPAASDLVLVRPFSVHPGDLPPVLWARSFPSNP